jgi:hypothetical protein
MAKPLSNTAFYVIANHGTSHPLADGDPQPSLFLAELLDGTFGLRCDHNDKTPRTPTFPEPDRTPKISSAQDSVRSSKAARFEVHESTSREYWLRGVFGLWYDVV